jgi:CHAD domain-containing protein
MSSVIERIRFYADRLLKEARRLPNRPESNDLKEHEKIHKIRVQSRRLETVFQLRPELKDRKLLRKMLKKTQSLRKSLGKIRELDVHFNQWRKLAAGTPPFQAVLKEIESRRERAYRKFLEKCNLRPIKKILKKMRRFPSNGFFAKKSGFSEAIPVQVDKILEDYEKYRYRHDLQKIHNIRIGIKRLRYSLEEILELSHPRWKRFVPHLKELQTELGEMHDLETMKIFLKKLLSKTEGRWDRPTRDGVWEVYSRINQRFQKSLDEWDKGWPAKQKALAALANTSKHSRHGRNP